MTPSTLDLSLFTQGNDSERHQLASDLLENLSQHGFVILINHGISDSTIKEMFEWSKSFFRLQATHKDLIAHQPGPDPQRGWSRVGQENSSSLYRRGLLKSEVREDLKDARVSKPRRRCSANGLTNEEHFDTGSKSDLQYANKWPDENVLPGFRTRMETVFETLEGISATIMEALEVAFKLPRGAFLDRMTHEGNASEMRLNHYPAIGIEEIRGGRVSRIWPHFDLGVITLLFQDKVGGLEFENRARSESESGSGAFLQVESGGPSEMVVNVSETLQRWTNDVLPAGLHQVNIPRNMEDRETDMLPERYSIAYFCKADRGASVAPLKHFVQEGIGPLYQDMLAIEYHQQRLQSAY